jgi:hypothetical protein
MNEKNLHEGQWEDRKQWNLGVGQRGRTFWSRFLYIKIFNNWHFLKVSYRLSSISVTTANIIVIYVFQTPCSTPRINRRQCKVIELQRSHAFICVTHNSEGSVYCVSRICALWSHRILYLNDFSSCILMPDYSSSKRRNT